MFREIPTCVVVGLLGAMLVASAALGSAEEPGQAPEPSAQLEKEHSVTLLVAEQAEVEAAALRSGEALDESRVAKIHEFFQNFTDRCHHAKEERFFFPAAVMYDSERNGPLVEELIAEHRYFRAIMQEIDYILRREEAVNTALLADRLDRYAEKLREHIRKENRVLYPQAGLVLPMREREALMVGFERVERFELGEGFHERYHRLAKEIAGDGGDQ